MNEWQAGADDLNPVEIGEIKPKGKDEHILLNTI